MRSWGMALAAWPVMSATKMTCKRIAAASMAVSLAALAGCAPPPYLLAGADPADPAVPVAAAGYRSTVAPYVHLRPAMPKGWLEQNQQVAPAPKPAQ